MNPNAFRTIMFSWLPAMLFFVIQTDRAIAQSPIQLQNWSGTIDLLLDNPVP